MLQDDIRRPPGAASTRVRLRVMAFLCVLSFLTYYDRQCIVRAQESIQKSLAISDEQMARVGSPEPKAIIRRRHRTGTGGVGRK